MADQMYLIGALVALAYLILPAFLVWMCVLLIGSRSRERRYGDTLRGIADQTKAVGNEAVAKQRDDMLTEARLAVYKPDGYKGHADG